MCMAASAVLLKAISVMKLTVITGGSRLRIPILLSYSFTRRFCFFIPGLEMCVEFIYEIKID